MDLCGCTSTRLHNAVAMTTSSTASNDVNPPVCLLMAGVSSHGGKVLYLPCQLCVAASAWGLRLFSTGTDPTVSDIGLSTMSDLS